MILSRQSRLLWVLLALISLAVPGAVASGGMMPGLEAAVDPSVAANARLPFLLGAPPPLALMLVGTSMVAWTVGRRLAVLRRLRKDSES